MHANAAVMHVWYLSAGNLKNSCGHLPNNKLKWMSVVELQ
jgi:hypothetical protein